MTTAHAEAGVDKGVRPDVLAYPSPATARYLVLVTALLATGLFVGNWLYTQVHGDAWVATMLDCLRQVGPTASGADALSSQAATAACQSGVETDRAMFSVAGAVFAGAVTVAVLFASPVVVRRRRRLRPLGAALSGAEGRFAELAKEAGVSRRVRPLVGPSTLRDAFSYGAPGRYAVALPPALAVRWRDRALFDPLVRHELAHARNRDVALAWLTRSVWFAVVPLLLLPVVASAVDGDLSLMPGYLWRAVVLALAFALLSAALLRAREHGADLRAARWQHDVGLMARIVASARPVAGTGPRGLVARHPTPAERAAVVEEPRRAVALEMWDGLTGAFLAGLAGPLIVSAVSPALATNGNSLKSYLIAAALLGPLVGASVGLSVWRAAVVARLDGEVAGVGHVATGAGVGLMLGLLVSLTQTGGGVLGFTQPATLPITGLACAGATVLSAGLAHTYADIAPRLSGPTPWRLLALGVNAVVFTAVFWASFLLWSLVEAGGWELGRIALVDSLTTTEMFLVAGALAAAAAVPLVVRRPRTPAAWQVEGDDPGAWPEVDRPGLLSALLLGVGGGLVGLTVMVTYRVVNGRAPTAAARWDVFEGFQWTGAVAAAVVGAVLIIRDPARGAARALVAVPVAASVASWGYLVWNATLGADLLAWSFDWMFWRPTVTLAFYATLAAALPAYLLGRLLRLPARLGLAGGIALAVVTLALSAGWAATAMVNRSHLVGYNPVGDPRAASTPAQDYRTVVVGPMVQDYSTLANRALAVDGATTLTAEQRSQAVRGVVAGVQALERQYADPGLGSSDVAEVHALALHALALAEQKYDVLARAYLLTDPAAVAAARQELSRLNQEENATWQAWQEQLADLGRPEPSVD